MSYFHRPSSYITSESALHQTLHQRGPLGRIVPSTDKADKAHSFIKNKLGLGINFSQWIPLRSCHDFFVFAYFFVVTLVQ